MTGMEEPLDRMKRRFAWYAGLWSAWAAEEEEAAWGPLVTAQVLEAHYYTEDNPLAQQPGLNRYRTSGTSSGRRKTIYYSPQDEDAYLRIKLNVFREILGGGEYGKALSDVGTGHAEATAVAVFRELGLEVESIPFQAPIEQHLERLAQFRPEVLYTMPSILERLLLAAPDPQAYGIRRVILVGELASRGWIRRAAERLGIGAEAVTDTYGSIEIGTIAYYSPRHDRYLFAEGIVPEGIGTEALGEGWEPLAGPDERVLVLSSTVREAFPALRYVTYDIVRDLRPVEVDGVQRASFYSLVKRIGPELKHGEKISLYDIEEAVYRHASGANVRVVVAGRRLRVHLAGTALPEGVLERVRQELESAIPEIGWMIQAGILERIQVSGDEADGAIRPGAVKQKKILYEGQEDSHEA